MITNLQFLTALFGADAPWVHVTDFKHDPSNIPQGRHLAAWKGDFFSRYRMGVDTNQYFTISNFYADEDVARRRKGLFRHTPVIVLDDVKEKLNMEEVSKLPSPSWVLETSPGSEQWGYILDTPCTDRCRVENLLDGLVANGLAPEGRDPGMKGVTRYVRLPEGINNKASKLVNGQPFKCVLSTWAPFNKVTMEQLAAPFSVNLDAARREQRVDGAAKIDDHPLLQVPDLLHIKEVRSDGRFDVTCPWVDEHTGGDDSGAAIFTNDDGGMGFKCHHGACQERTGRHLMDFIEREKAGFKSNYAAWQAMRSFSDIVTPTEVSFVDPAPAPVSFMAPVEPPAPAPVAPAQEAAVSMESVMAEFYRIPERTAESYAFAGKVLKVADSLLEMERVAVHTQVAHRMHWNKTEFQRVLKNLREEWYSDSSKGHDFYEGVMFVKELNQFFDWNSRIFYSPDSFQNSHSHEDPEARKAALQDGLVTKVDRLDYAPKAPRVFDRGGVKYGNTYVEGETCHGAEGDVSRWLKHFDILGWADEREHILQWMAYTIRHPETKINHALLLGSGEGCGKDFLLTPLMEAMGRNAIVISGDELANDFNDFVLDNKLLLVNEVDTGDKQDAKAIGNRVKKYAAAPPDKLRVNQKGIKPIEVSNIINVAMTTNSTLPIRIDGASRRFFALWSDFNPRDVDDNMLPDWLAYWDDLWPWMRSGGAQACIWFLRNKVDISNFNPRAVPKMTGFLRDMAETSKSPMQQTVDAFISNKIGNFAADLISAADASQTLRAGEVLAPNLVYCDTRRFTPTTVSRMFKGDPRVRSLRAKRAMSQVRMWAVRDGQRYSSMTASDLFDAYELAQKVAKAPALEIVG